uniref:Transcription initiation factor IIF subunit alpha n=1 Tax=Glossina austeni TaxID=7395 RepID=A0A1A9VP90_GLOAU
MHFNATLNVDFAQWRTVKLERENNLKEFNGMEEDMPKFGVESEEEVKNELTSNDSAGAVFGPDWHQHFRLQGSLKDLENYTKPIMHYNCQVSSMVPGEDKWCFPISTQ